MYIVCSIDERPRDDCIIMYICCRVSTMSDETPKYAKQKTCSSRICMYIYIYIKVSGIYIYNSIV